MEERIEELDWVTQRSECSLSVIFEKLKTQIQADVKTRNSMRPELAPYIFNISVKGDTIIVTADSNRPYMAVQFELSGKSIVVKNKRDEVMAEATLTLNDRGECKLKVASQEQELWQFRRKALEDLFFNYF